MRFSIVDISLDIPLILIDMSGFKRKLYVESRKNVMEEIGKCIYCEENFCEENAENLFWHISCRNNFLENLVRQIQRIARYSLPEMSLYALQRSLFEIKELVKKEKLPLKTYPKKLASRETLVLSAMSADIGSKASNINAPDDSPVKKNLGTPNLWQAGNVGKKQMMMALDKSGKIQQLIFRI